MLGCAFALSFLFNVLAVLVFFFGCFGILSRSSLSSVELATIPLIEVQHSGNSRSSNKIAIVQLRDRCRMFVRAGVFRPEGAVGLNVFLKYRKN